jgi:hypothetical protein
MLSLFEHLKYANIPVAIATSFSKFVLAKMLPTVLRTNNSTLKKGYRNSNPKNIITELLKYRFIII